MGLQLKMSGRLCRFFASSTYLWFGAKIRRKRGLFSILKDLELEKGFHFIPPFWMADSHSSTHSEYTKKWPHSFIWPMMILKSPS